MVQKLLLLRALMSPNRYEFMNYYYNYRSIFVQVEK